MNRRALVLDFDGLIVDTETSEFESWREVYAEHGATLTADEWTKAVGWVDHFDPRAHLEFLTGRSLDWMQLDERRRKRHWDLVERQPMLPGVLELIESGIARGYHIGVASNSSAAWVEKGLSRLGIRNLVQTVRTRDRVDSPKPDADPYRKVLQDLRAVPAKSIAFEDSHPGVVSAKAAGLHVVAVPNSLTRQHDLSRADVIVDSLAGFVL